MLSIAERLTKTNVESNMERRARTALQAPEAPVQEGSQGGRA